MNETGVRCLRRVRPERNEWRWYAIAWGPTLFGTWGVHLSWGRLGTNRYQQRILEFSSAEEAVHEADAQVERRRRRGYTSIVN
jgi:predicted DNA-binding WGR domain protein